MRRNLMRKGTAAALIAVLLIAALGGCAKKADPADPYENIGKPGEPAATTQPEDKTQAEDKSEPEDKTGSDTPAEPDPQSGTARQDGERFEGTVAIEGMEETVKYEHVRSEKLGFELDYDYESLLRRSEADRECFISIYDDPEAPENWLVVDYSPVDAETEAAAIMGNLSDTFKVSREDIALENAGSCICLNASEETGSTGVPGMLMTVYILPASNGSCRIATARTSFEAAEGFGALFRGMMDSFAVIDRKTDAQITRQDGERFEAVIMLEGMEETVKYEHVRSDVIGFEIDYDYESLTRRSEGGSERFLSIYDDPQKPWNYLEVTYSVSDAEKTAARISEDLSHDYELTRESFVLDGAGSCILIDASVVKGSQRMADELQTVYIIPASDGSCRIATVHCTIESAEGFGRRFDYMMQTFKVVERPEETPELRASRKDGERFEGSIILEGMEETVKYEHLIRETMGFEMDYDYETLIRKSEADKETFVLVYDDPEKPENYFEITRRDGDAETVAAAISEELSREYGILQENEPLKRAGDSIYIEASTTRDGKTMVDPIQWVSVIPAGDGCVVVWTHCALVDSEDFGSRVDHMLDTLAILPRS